MATKSAVFKFLLHASLFVLLFLTWLEPSYAQPNFVHQFTRVVDGQVIHVLKPKYNSAVEAQADSVDVQILVCGWELGTEESNQHLSSLLNRFARRYIDKEIKKSQFTPQEIAKLELAARLQVARDCRAIQQLGSAYRYQRAAKVNLLKTCIAIEELIDIGVDRKDSLYSKVKNNLR